MTYGTVGGPHPGGEDPAASDPALVVPLRENLREDSALPPLAEDSAREAVLALPELRLDHRWTDGRLTAASVLDSDGSLVATVERVGPNKPEARFFWILGDIKSTRWLIRDPDGRVLWELMRKPHFGGAKADMGPVPDAGVVRAIRGMPWSRTDFALYGATSPAGYRVGAVRWSGGIFAQQRVVVDPALRPVLRTYDHGRGPWSDYSVRWVDGADDAPEPLRTAGLVSILCLHTALTKVRN